MDNTKKLQTLSLCTGYGGIERGLELAGEKLNVLAHVEVEAFACANLVAKMEEGKLGAAPIWTDLKTLPAHVFRDAVDVLTGGYPCQPFSAAGKRQGADDPRHLWPHICRIIDEVRPKRCFFENVEGHISLGLREVLADLEARGYSTTWGIFSASEVGAPHQRKRVFILAHTRRSTKRIKEPGQGGLVYNERDQGEERSKERFGLGECCEMVNTNSKGWDRSGQPCGSEASQSGPAVSSWNGFPSRPGGVQHDWEASRTIKPSLGRATNGTTNRVDRLRLLGNGVVPQTAALAWRTLNNNISD